MVFLDSDYWTKQIPIYPLLCDLLEKGSYKNLLLSLADQEMDIIEQIEAFPKN
jgi:hypothetical protein